MPAWIPPAIAAAGTIGATGLGAANTSNLNKKSRRFSREMYARQKNDNIEFWNMQNSYNDPSAVMERMREAGLNPAMMYGSGGGGNGGQAGPLHSPSAMAAKFESADFKNLGRVVSDYQQTGLMVKQGQMMDSVILKNAAEAEAISTRREGNEFDNYMSRKLEDISTDMKSEAVKNLQARTKATLDANERQAAIHSKNLTMAIERIAEIRIRNQNILPAQEKQIKQQIEVLKQDKMIKYYEKKMREKGLSFQDPRIWRLLSTGLDKLMQSDPKRFNSQGLKRILQSAMEELLGK